MQYRIVRDTYLGYAAEWRTWYWPFWMECFCGNTSATLEKAREVCDRHRNGLPQYFVEYYNPSAQKAVRGTKENTK